MHISNAIVIGGGVGGLAAATALAQRGVAVTLLERSKALRAEGAGIQISPNGLAVLRALGLHDLRAVKARAVVLRAFDHPDPPVALLDLARHAGDLDYLFMHRADLIEALGAAARRANVSFELGCDVTQITPARAAGDLPALRLADGSTRRAELIIGADGIHSTARAVLNGPDRAQFSGQVAWRAVIPNTVDHPAQAWLTMGPGCHLVSYPLRGGREINLVAVQERSDWAAEGWRHSDDPAHLRAAFSGFGGVAGQMLDAVTEATLWGLHLHPVAATWQGGGLALLGDAAHPTLPFLAQGANLALEDAWVLASTLGRGETLADYQSARAPRAARIIKAATGNAWKYHLKPGPIRSAAHLGLRLGSRVAPARMVSAFDWIYRHDVTR
ncbi:MAG: FAD-dependent monooxygenase [Sulfitobacter sp.]